jgi:tetratricopeptide (TPR) repeat protein
LPPEVSATAQPMIAARWPGEADVDVCGIWDVLELQRRGRLESAIQGWGALRLPPSAGAWREIALAAAHLELANLPRAAAALTRAEQADPANAVVHYYLGVLRLEQAARAAEWYDAIEPQDVRLVTYPGSVGAPNSKGGYRLAAAAEFEEALVLAAHLDRSKPLVADKGPSRGAEPTVGDLLAALGASRFEANCHVILGDHYLHHGALEVAEQHMDEACTAGLHVAYGYRALAEEYETLGRHTDAARAFAKDMKCGGGFAVSLRRIAWNLREALVRDF